MGRGGSVVRRRPPFDPRRLQTDQRRVRSRRGRRGARQSGRRLAAGSRDDDVVARVGGDEFAVLSHSVAAADELEHLAARLSDLVVAPVRLADGTEVRVGVSIGACLAPLGSPAEALLRAADTAMYEAKAAGGGGWRIVDLVGVTSPVDH